MAKIWIKGTFIDGAVTETNILPVVRGSDSITININNEDFATLAVSKRDLPNPAEWKTYLKPVYTLIAAVNTEKAWNEEGSVLFAGFVKEVKMGVKEAIQIQVAGFREYASLRQPTNVYTGSVNDPEAGVTFQGSNFQRLTVAIMRDVWNNYSQSSSVPRPPSTIGTPTVAQNTGTVTYKTKNNEFLSISDYLDDIRDNISLNGNEYRFVPRWSSSSKTAIVWDQVVGSEAQPQIWFNTQTFNVNLDDNNFVTTASNSLTSTDYATRLLGVSVIGDDTTPSDMKIITSAEANSILVDAQFNPQVELEPATLNSQMTSRMNFMKNLQEAGEVMVIRNAEEKWVTRVGAKVEMVSGGSNPETSGVNITTRLVEVKFSLSSTEVKTTIMSIKPKYGKLPNSPTNPNKFNGTQPGNSYPIVPKVPNNTPIPSGGGSTPTMPNFELPNAWNNSTESIWENYSSTTASISGGAATQTGFQYKERVFFLNYFGQITKSNDGADLDPQEIKIYSINCSGATSAAAVPGATEVGSLPASLYASELLPNHTWTPPIIGGWGYEAYTFIHHNIAFFNNKIYIFLTSTSQSWYLNQITNKQHKNTKAKSLVYSASWDGSSLGSFTLETWDLTNPYENTEIIYPLQRGIAPMENGSSLGIFGSISIPKEAEQIISYPGRMPFPNQNLGIQITGVGVKRQGTAPGLISQGIFSNTSVITCAWDHSASTIVIANMDDSSPEKSLNSWQLASASQPQFSYAPLFQIQNPYFPVDGTKFGGLAVLNSWVLYNGGNSNLQGNAPVFRGKIGIQGQVIENQELNSQRLITLTGWGPGPAPFSGNYLNYFSINSGESLIAVNEDFSSQNIFIPLSNNYAVSLSPGYSSFNVEVARLKY